MQEKLSFLKKFAGELISKRLRRRAISSEFLERELSESVNAFIVSVSETAFLFLILSCFIVPFSLSNKFFFVFFAAWLIWKTASVAYQSWKKLFKLHDIIQEEKWEIEHHRENEKKEIETLYSAKGFSGKLLDDVVTTLMADDNRLLEVMLEEEMGIALESFEHPLKQALGAGLGIFLVFSFTMGFFILFPSWGIPVVSFSLFALSSFFCARYEKLGSAWTLLWNLGIAALAYASCIFLTSLFFR